MRSQNRFKARAPWIEHFRLASLRCPNFECKCYYSIELGKLGLLGNSDCFLATDNESAIGKVNETP